MAVGDDHRPERAHAVRSDTGSVLGLDRARRADDRGGQLLARRHRDAPVRGGARARRAHPGELLSERRSPERVRWLRRDARDHERSAGRVRRGGAGQHRGRMLRHHAGAHPHDRRHGERRGPPPGADVRRSLHHPQRPRAVPHHARHGVRDGRRAHQHHGLGQVPPPDRVRRLPERRRRGARAGAERGERDRREHGRRPARLREGDDHVPEPRRDGAGDRARADHDRQLQVVGDRGRPEVRAGPRHRELDQPEGRRGGLPGEGATDQAVRSRRRRDGVRRTGAGWHGRPQDRDQRTRVPAVDPGRRLRPVGHHLRPQHPGHRDRHGRAQRVREVVHRGDPRDQAPLPGREGVGRCVQPVVLVPWQRAGPSGDPLGVPLPRDVPRAWTWPS